MTTKKKIYGPWIKWHGGECPVPPVTAVKTKLRNGSVWGPGYAGNYQWLYHGVESDIVEYCIVTEQADLKAAEQLLLANAYTVIPPAKPLTFKDVAPMTEAPENGGGYWVVHPFHSKGVAFATWRDSESDQLILKRRMAYLEKEHALVAAQYIFGLKGGEL